MKLEIKSQDEVKDLELGKNFAPKFDQDGLIPVIATDHKTNEVLMFAFMNEVSLKKSIVIGEAIYWSRSRKELWHKGATSGHIQKIVELRVDCDQDCLWIKIEQKGGACHLGYRSCFYRGAKPGDQELSVLDKEVFDANQVYR